MKTSKFMTIKIGDVSIEAESLKKEIDLTSLFKAVNADRLLRGKAVINHTNFMNSAGTKEFIKELEENGYENPVRHNGKKGKLSKTYSCVTFAIYVAQQASPKFNRMMIEEFIAGRILENRSEGCDLFKGLNIAIDTKLKGREGKNNRNLYIQCAKRIKEIVKPNEGDWNKATAEQTKRRVDIEERVITVLSTGLVEGKEGIYLDEVFYEHGLLTNEISNLIRGSYEVMGRGQVIADSAEPRTIEELFRMGINIKPCVKGKDSIINGIDIMKQHKMFITKRSKNLIDELYSYQWLKDKRGNLTNQPDPRSNDHAIDAARYVCSFFLSQRKKNYGTYNISLR